ncbi:MAG: hypothetical protein K8R36_12165 [Planctomycetales bacterium]|nr:hypothetical protein [Planctomycetales bacterium]
MAGVAVGGVVEAAEVGAALVEAVAEVNRVVAGVAGAAVHRINAAVECSIRSSGWWERRRAGKRSGNPF